MKKSIRYRYLVYIVDEKYMRRYFIYTKKNLFLAIKM